MLQEVTRSREVSILDVDFDNELVWWCTAPEDNDPPPPPSGGEDPPSDDPGSDGGGGSGAGISVSTGSGTFQSLTINGSSSTAEYKMTASYSGNSAGHNVRRRFRYYQDGVNVSGFGANHGTSTASSWSWNSESNGQTNGEFECDDNQWSWRGRVYDLTDTEEVNGSIKYFKSYAIPMTADAPTSDVLYLTDTEAYISADFFPNSKHSTVTAQLEYKKTTDSEWLAIGSSANTNGYSEVTISRGLTGLESETSYDIRLSLSRNSQNETSLTSSTGNFTTLASDPVATTSAATNATAGVAGVSDDGTATLNGSVDRNDNSDAEWRFAYGTSSGALDTFTTWTATTSEPESVQSAITGLTESLTYYFELQVRWNSGAETTEGDELSFAVPADPAAEAAQEDHLLIYTFTRKYGVICDDSSQRKIRFALPDEASTSSDRFITDASPFASGDVKISKDGGALANTTNLPTQITASLPVYELQLEATEMQADDIVISIVDQDGPAFRDVIILIETEILLGNFDIDAASGSKADTSAFKVSGYGAGHGIEAIAGATGQDINGILGEMILRAGTSGSAGSPTGSEFELDSSANSTNDYYNGSIVMLISGTGAGQSRVITDYNGTSKIATLDTAWVTGPSYGTTRYMIVTGARPWSISAAAELSGIPTETSSYGDKLSFVFQRFAFKVDQTATVQTWYQSDSSTTLGTRSVADDGTTQTLGKIS